MLAAAPRVRFWQILLRKSSILGVRCLDWVLEVPPSIRLDGGSTNRGLGLGSGYEVTQDIHVLPVAVEQSALQAGVGSGDSSERKLILRIAWAAQAKPTKSQKALEMGKQHLDALATVPRLLERRGACECSGDIASILMDAARDFAPG
jgi:hypothetical protein